MRGIVAIVCLTLACSSVGSAAQLTAAAEEDFANYIREVEMEFGARLSGRKPLLWVQEAGAREVKVRRAGVIVEPSIGNGDKSIRNGLIHDWTAAAFVPDATVTQVVKVVSDYDHHAETYAPEVVDSRVIEQLGPKYHVFLRLKKKKVLTAVLNTEHRAEYRPLNNLQWFGLSRSTRIQEVEDAGGPRESLKPVGQDRGFLWKLNVYWRFAQVTGGTIVECRAVSLTRDIPTGLGWMIRPIVRSLPRESLEKTLTATRRAVMNQAGRKTTGTTL